MKSHSCRFTRIHINKHQLMQVEATKMSLNLYKDGEQEKYEKL